MERGFDINENGWSVRCRLHCADARNIREIVIFGHGFAGHKDSGFGVRLAEQILKKI